MPLYRSKPKTVSAEQFTTTHTPEGVVYRREPHDPYNEYPFVKTAQDQWVQINHNEWVVTEAGGRGHYPVADDIFRKSYKPAEPTLAAGRYPIETYEASIFAIRLIQGNALFSLDLERTYPDGAARFHMLAATDARTKLSIGGRDVSATELIDWFASHGGSPAMVSEDLNQYSLITVIAFK